MATIWTFGDSMTERFNSNSEWGKNYIEWKQYVPKVYGEIISEMMQYDLKNFGKAGFDNYSILESFCKAYQDISDDDIVIIGWSYFGRFRLVNKENKWTSLLPNFNNYLNNFDCISENTINEILINRMNYKYVQEVNHWINFINLACSNKKIIHWSTNRGENELNTHHFFEMERIETETNGLISDYHFSENGHKLLADKLIHLIFNNIKPINNKLI